MALAEHCLGEFMRNGLIFTGEVQVDIGGLVTLEAKEGFKRNIVAVPCKRSSADRAELFGQIYSASGAVPDIRKFTVFAVWTAIVCREGIYLRYACHMCNER